jgi:TrmH family RNA methyltransferase
MRFPQHITRRQNSRVKDATKLRDRRQRERQGRFLIDGAREILRAIAAGLEIVEAFVCEPLLGNAEARNAAAKLRETAAVYSTVTEEVFDKLCFGERTGGVLAVGRTPEGSLTRLQVPPKPLVAVIEGVEKPGNLGAILRSADGAGMDAVLIADSRTDLFNPNTVRASLGAVFNANVCAATTEAVLDWLRQRRIPIFAARPEAKLLYTEANYRDGAAFVLGSEAGGLSEKWAGSHITGVRLPMRGIADSLNVSATAAVLFYEVQRQSLLAPGQ